MAKIRAFIAVPLPTDVVRTAVAIRDRCERIRKAVRWVAPERIHLTLKFLGDMAVDQVAAVSDLLENVARAAGQFQLKAGGLGVFPTVKRPRVLWMGVAGDTAPLIAFARNLDTRLTRLGFAGETRPFRAHVTLGRFKAKTDARQLTEVLLAAAEVAPVAFSADQVMLFKSELKPSGAVHTPLAAVPLAGGDDLPCAPGRYS